MKRKERELVAIKVTRVYNNMTMQAEFKKRTYADYLLIKKTAKEEPHLFEMNMKNEDKLRVPPQLLFHEGDFGFEPADLLKGKKTPIIAEMQYHYKTPYHLQKKSYFGKIIFGIIILAIMAMAFNLYVGYRSTQIAEIEAACRVFTKYGTPQFMVIDGKRYDLNAYGDVVEEQRIFINPWHAEQVETKQGCQLIGLK